MAASRPDRRQVRVCRIPSRTAGHSAAGASDCVKGRAVSETQQRMAYQSQPVTLRPSRASISVALFFALVTTVALVENLLTGTPANPIQNAVAGCILGWVIVFSARSRVVLSEENLSVVGMIRTRAWQ